LLHQHSTSTFQELAGSVAYWFTNTDELVNFPAATGHKVIDIAGVGMEKTVKKSGQLDKVKLAELG
jgi:hypothetical protein